MIALGFCDDRTGLPTSLTTTELNGFFLISAPEFICKTAREKLKLLVTCFHAGANVLSLPVNKNMQATDINYDVPDIELDYLFSVIKEKGQFTISIEPQRAERPISTDRSGRRWLNERREYLEGQQRAQIELHRILSAFGPTNPSTGISSNPKTTHLLIDRCLADLSLDLLKNEVVNSRALTDQKVTVTGLWPPLCFAEFPTTKGLAA